MPRLTWPVRRASSKFGTLPSFVQHTSFSDRTAEKTFDAQAVLETWDDPTANFMPDDVTRAHAQCLHYAAFRMHGAVRRTTFTRWHGHYIALRDRIVLGNRKLIYRAVHRRMGSDSRTEDLIGDCHIVLINAVQVYNPWMGIRFSTYAFTCLVRALSRIAQKSAHDQLALAMSYDVHTDFQPAQAFTPELHSNGGHRLEDFFRDDHPLLTEREKGILQRRFLNAVDSNKATLESVGSAMGLSKERVRQVQTIALDKLRKALTEPATHFS